MRSTACDRLDDAFMDVLFVARLAAPCSTMSMTSDARVTTLSSSPRTRVSPLEPTTNLTPPPPSLALFGAFAAAAAPPLLLSLSKSRTSSL